MRIQEMRSGLPHLRKKVVAGEQEDFFAARLAKEAFIEAVTEFISSDEPEAPICDLAKPMWSVVSFEGVEARGLIHASAVKLLGELDAKGVTGLCIVTDAAAARIAH